MTTRGRHIIHPFGADLENSKRKKKTPTVVVDRRHLQSSRRFIFCLYHTEISLHSPLAQTLTFPHHKEERYVCRKAKDGHDNREIAKTVMSEPRAIEQKGLVWMSRTPCVSLTEGLMGLTLWQK